MTGYGSGGGGFGGGSSGGGFGGGGFGGPVGAPGPSGPDLGGTRETGSYTSGGGTIETRTSDPYSGETKVTTETYTEKKVEWDALEIVAILSGVIALLFAIAIIMGWLALNKATISVITLSVVCAAAAKVGSNKRKEKEEDR